jgi:hypothetical protein
VRIIQRAGDLARDLQRLVDAQPMLAIELVAQRFSAHVRQHAVEVSRRLARVEQIEDVRMVELRGDPDLGEEALGAEHGAELGAEDLERDLAIQLPVAGQVDDGHAAGAELAFYDVAIIECCGNQRGFVAHGEKVRRTRRERQSRASPRQHRAIASRRSALRWFGAVIHRRIPRLRTSIAIEVPT